MIFGRWHLLEHYLLLSYLVCRFFTTKACNLEDSIYPSEFLAMAPYLVTIIVVAGIVGNAKPPQAIGQAYVKEN